MDFSLFKYVGSRSLGRSGDLGLRDNIYSSLYSTMTPVTVTDSTPCNGLDWGAVFGFGFSPDGSLLAAACENKCMLLYDPNNARLIQRRFKTHTDCVNCVRFLDNRTFATCSDDSTIRLWDARFLSSEIRILRGHTSWVKNIEYSCNEGKLITSGFDGNIFAWDVNNYSENETAEPLFYINGMMRTKITPDEKKLIISTHRGYFLLVHNLELRYLKEDLSGFKPHLYRSMQLRSRRFHQDLRYNHMFTRKRNRIEFMCDFPVTDNAASISTMQVHPQGWCITSRNTTLDEESEWTCIHDIQNFDNESEFKERFSSSESTESTNAAGDNTGLDSQTFPESGSRQRINLFLQSLFDYPSVPDPSDIRSNLNSSNLPNGSGLLNNGEGNISSESDLTSSEDDDSNSHEALSAQISSPRLRDTSFSSDTSSEELSNFSVHTLDRPPQASGDLSLSTLARRVSTFPLISVSDRFSSSFFPEQDHRHSESEPPHFQQNGESIGLSDRHRALIFYDIPSNFRVSQQMTAHLTDQDLRQPSLRIHRLRIRNVKPRLLFYSEEPNVGRGFIKEQSFSADGRVIASPFGNCVRLLAFNGQCSELCDCVPTKPKALVQVGLAASQKSSILASTFSPNHCMFVAGARDGSISFCSPKL